MRYGCQKIQIVQKKIFRQRCQILDLDAEELPTPKNEDLFMMAQRGELLAAVYVEPESFLRFVEASLQLDGQSRVLVAFPRVT